MPYMARRINYHTDSHGCPRMIRRLYVVTRKSLISTDDTENYFITRTITDVHG